MQLIATCGDEKTSFLNFASGLEPVFFLLFRSVVIGDDLFLVFFFCINMLFFCINMLFVP
nr:MAG TPA: hypothetical protein [Caudoviricetes sp.]